MTASFQNVAAIVRQVAHIDAADGSDPDPTFAVRDSLDGLRVSKYHYRRLCEEYEKAYQKAGAA